MEQKKLIIVSTLDYVESFSFLEGLKTRWARAGVSFKLYTPNEIDLGSYERIKLVKKILIFWNIILAFRGHRYGNSKIYVIGERTCALMLLFTKKRFTYIHDEFFTSIFKKYFTRIFTRRCHKIITFCNTRSKDLDFLRSKIDLELIPNVNPYLSFPKKIKKENLIVWNGSRKKYVSSGFKSLINNYSKEIFDKSNLSFLVRSKGTLIPDDFIGNDIIKWDSDFVDFENMIYRISKCRIGLVMYYHGFSHPNFDLIGKSSGQLNTYLQLGIPVVAQRMTGLSWVDDYNCVLQFDKLADIPILIERISSDYEYYGKNARECYEKELKWM